MGRVDPAGADFEEASRRRTLALLFFLAGAATLVAEQASEKILGTLLGVTTAASAAVLAAFFAGLGAGGLLHRRLLRNGIGTPWGRFALSAAVIAGWAGAWAAGYDAFPSLLASLLAFARGSSAALGLARLLVASLVVLPPALASGALLPAALDVADRRGGTGAGASALYAVNLLGSLAGAIGATWVLFPAVGVDGSLAAVALFSAALVLAARRRDRRETSPSLAAAPIAPKNATPDSGERLLVFSAAFSGFLLLALEVLWTHLLAATTAASAYAFTTMLGAVLGGLAAGAFLAARVLPRLPLGFWLPGLALEAGALVLLATSGRWPSVPSRVTALRDTISFAGLETLRWREAALLIVPSAILFGILFPALFRLDLFPEGRRAPLAGTMTAANALGGIAGALAAGLVFLPLAGSEASLKLLAFLAAAAGLVLVLRFGTPPLRAAGVALAAGTLLLLATSAPWNRRALAGVPAQPAGLRLIFFSEDPGRGLVTVLQDDPAAGETWSPVRILFLNGQFQGDDRDEMERQSAIALVPLAFVRDPRSALVIGLGTGRTAAIPRLLGVPSVTVAETSPGIVRAARLLFPHVNAALLDDPHVRLEREDGRSLLARGERSWDLVAIEITGVWAAGATNLYSREFYRAAARRLRPGGALAQWVPLFHIDIPNVGAALATLRGVFPYVSLWRVGNLGLTVATAEPQVVSAAFLDAVARDGERLGWPRDQLALRLRSLLASRLLAPADVDAFLAKGAFPLVTDRNRRFEWATPRFWPGRLRREEENRRTLASWSSFAPPPVAEGATGPLADAARQLTAEDVRQSLAPAH